jgi:glutaredoxin-dependent peroxiredoxin
MPLTIGQSAPDFSLYNSEKNKISLSGFNGNKNVLLLFFPQAFTGVCTKELCSVRDNINRYQNESTEVLGISVDSVFSLAKFKEEQQYNFSLLSDFNKDVSNLYEAIHESFTDMGMLGVSKRSAFIIDKAGILQYVEVLDNPGLMPDFDKIDEKLTELAG